MIDKPNHNNTVRVDLTRFDKTSSFKDSGRLQIAITRTDSVKKELKKKTPLIYLETAKVQKKEILNTMSSPKRPMPVIEIESSPRVNCNLA